MEQTQAAHCRYGAEHSCCQQHQLAPLQDFVTLRFIPKGTNLDPILPVLANVFDQALDGGGAKNINFQSLSADLANITYHYPFRIPPCAPLPAVQLSLQCFALLMRLQPWVCA